MVLVDDMSDNMSIARNRKYLLWMQGLEICVHIGRVVLVTEQRWKETSDNTLSLSHVHVVYVI